VEPIGWLYRAEHNATMTLYTLCNLICTEVIQAPIFSLSKVCSNSLKQSFPLERQWRLFDNYHSSRSTANCTGNALL